MSARRIAGGVGCSLALAAWLVLPLLAQWQAALTYRSRGRYSEGIRTAPSTGETLDLISALVDYREPYKDLPAAFRAMFYLPKQASVYLAIREVEARYYYWLDMQPDPGWQAASANRFEWPTGTVIRSLKWKEGAPLSLDDLGATARLDSPDPGTMERVAPVAEVRK